MKGLYCKLSGDQGDVKFLVQETSVPTDMGDHQVKVQVKSCALSPVEFKLYEDLKLGMEHYPVGREIAGVVLQVGPKVTFFQPDDEVVGILPLDVELSGLCSVVLIDEYNLVQKPEKVSWFDAVAAIKDGLRAYTALHTLARMAAGQTLLVLDGASPFGVVAIQLAHYHGVKVMATALSPEDQKFLEELRPSVARVIKVWDSKEDLVDSCLEETGGLGLDIIIDSGVRLYEEELEAPMHLPHKHDLITLLAVGGHWVTTEQNLQLDPPDSHILFLKAASVSFLNEEVWAASRAKQGRYLRIFYCKRHSSLTKLSDWCCCTTEQSGCFYQECLCHVSLQNKIRNYILVRVVAMCSDMFMGDLGLSLDWVMFPSQSPLSQLLISSPSTMCINKKKISA